MASALAVDSFLGKGWYRAWQDLEQRADIEKRKLRFHESYLSRTTQWDQTSQLWSDMKILDGVRYDFSAAMEKITAGRQLDPEEVGGLHDIYTLALGVVEAENDAMRLVFSGGAAAAINAIPFAIVSAKAIKLTNQLPALTEQLLIAHRQVAEARLQFTFNAAIIAIQVIIPKLGLVKRAGMFIGQFVIDKLLGPNKYVSRKVAAVGVHSVAMLEENVKQLHKLGRKGAAGGGVLALALDAVENQVALNNRNELIRMITEVDKELDSLIRLLEKHAAQFKRVTTALIRLEELLADQRDGVWYIRDARDDEMRRRNYSGRNAKVWRAKRAD